MKSLAITKEIQSLTSRASTLNRFLSRSTNKCRLFFKALKKGQRDKWDEECEAAFPDLMAYLTSPPQLSKPQLGEDLFIYLVVSNLAVKSALIQEELGGITSGILHVKSSHQCRDSLSENGEAHFGPLSLCEKIKTLLSSSPDDLHDKISFKIDSS
ncbi:unnamed protein product [Prunus armeniaca]